jgi:PAS domain S-box-containing protein
LAEGDDVLTQGERPLAELARDIVERRLAEKRLAESQLRLQAVVESAPFGAHMYELTDDDRLVFVGYNRKAQEMLGVDHDELIGLTLEEAFPGNAGTETPAQYRRVAREQVTWETEELAYDAGGISGVFEVLAFPFGPERMAVFFRDITEKRRLEIALEQGDVRYRRLIRNMREGFAYCRLLFDDFGEPVDWLFLDANDKIDRSMSGHHVTGKRALEVWPEVRSLAPELFDACCRVGISREPEELDFRVGPETWVHYSVTSPEQNHFVVVGSDVSARKCAEEGLARTARALRALSGVNEVLVHAETEDDLLAAVCEVVVRDAGYALTWVGYAEQDEGRSVRPRMHYGEGSDYLESVTVSWGEGPLGQGPTGRSIRECEPVVMHDMQTDPSYEPWKGPAIARGFESSVSLPLVDQNGVTFGALVIYSRDRDAFDGEEMNLLSEMAEDLSYGISTIRARERHEETGRELIRTNERLEGVLKSITETMGKVIEMRDPYTQGHELGVATISRQIAMEIGLSEDEVDGIEVAALVHDIGKLAVPVEILTKPGKLTDIEFEIIKVHSQCGYDVLKDIDFDWPVAEAVLQHHERMDGSGYPSGLRGEEILMAARVLMVADVLEAMAADRPYRPALGLDAAMAEITGHPEKFEPRVVEACVRLFEEGRLELGGHP